MAKSKIFTYLFIFITLTIALFTPITNCEVNYFNGDKFFIYTTLFFIPYTNNMGYIFDYSYMTLLPLIVFLVYFIFSIVALRKKKLILCLITNLLFILFLVFIISGNYFQGYNFLTNSDVETYSYSLSLYFLLFILSIILFNLDYLYTINKIK